MNNHGTLLIATKENVSALLRGEAPILARADHLFDRINIDDVIEVML